MVEVVHLFLYPVRNNAPLEFLTGFTYYWDRAINRTKGNTVIDAFILKKVTYSFSEKELRILSILPTRS